jgi:hypothetical protein
MAVFHHFPITRAAEIRHATVTVAALSAQFPGTLPAVSCIENHQLRQPAFVLHAHSTDIERNEHAVDRFSTDDPHDLVLLVAGFLYVTGHAPIQMDDAAIRRAVPAARELLRALGITPANIHNPETGS